MATITTNLKLTKPGYDDLFDISIWDDNMDIIDHGVAANQDELNNHERHLAELDEEMDTHKHSADDITSGTIPIVHGGTGASTASGAVANIGAAPRVHQHSTNDLTSGTLPIVRGGTGSSTASGAVTNLGAAPRVHTHTMSDITGGTVSPSMIPGLDASKITSGTLAAGRIPNLDASKITSGVFASSMIPGLDASKITSGVLPIARGGTGGDYASLAQLIKNATGQKFAKLDVIGDWFDNDDYGGGTHEGGDRSGKPVSYDCQLSANPFDYDLVLCVYGPKIYLQFDGVGDYYEGGFAVMPMWVTTKSDAGHRVADNFAIDFCLISAYNYFDSYANKRYPDIVKALGTNNSTNTSYTFYNKVNLSTVGGNRATISCGHVAMQNANGYINTHQFFDVVNVTKKVGDKNKTYTYKYLCCTRLYGMLGVKFS